MQLSIVSKNDEPLLSRTAVRATLEFERATPSYSEVTQLLASHLKVEDKLIAVRHIYTTFGTRKAEIIAYFYSNEAKKQYIEPKVKVKKEKKSKEKK